MDKRQLIKSLNDADALLDGLTRMDRGRPYLVLSDNEILHRVHNARQILKACVLELQEGELIANGTEALPE